MKKKIQCNKFTYNSLREAWEAVIYFRRKGYKWQEPYVCKCGEYHLTASHFSGRVPKWVKEAASRPSKKEQKKRERETYRKTALPLSEQKKLLQNLNIKQPSFLQKLIHRVINR